MYNVHMAGTFTVSFEFKSLFAPAKVKLTFFYDYYNIILLRLACRLLSQFRVLLHLRTTNHNEHKNQTKAKVQLGLNAARQVTKHTTHIGYQQRSRSKTAGRMSILMQTHTYIHTHECTLMLYTCVNNRAGTKFDKHRIRYWCQGFFGIVFFYVFYAQ